MPYSHNVKKLEELILGSRPGEVSYTGGVHGEHLYKNTDFAIQRSFLPAGTTLDIHEHNVTEIIIGLSGCAKISSEAISKDLHPGEVIYLKPRQAHKCEASEDSWVLGILVPCNGGYPDSK